MSMASGSGSGKVLGRNSAYIFRKCTASRSRKEEEKKEGKKLAGLHLVVGVLDDKYNHRYYANSCYDQKWSREIKCLRFPIPAKGHRFLGGCNGLLCLEISAVAGFANDADTKCVVWEPSTNKLQVIPQPISMKRPCDYCPCVADVVVGGSDLFFNSQSGDYNFFCFSENMYDHGDDEWSISTIIAHAQVYSVKDNVWKELNYPLMKEGQIKAKGNGVCVNGVCYWHARCVNDDSFILSFDFVTEEFSTFYAPKHCAFKLVELDGSLGLLIYPFSDESSSELDSDSDSDPDESSSEPVKDVISLMVYSPSSSWSRADSGFDVPVVGFHNPLWFGKRNGSYYLLVEGPLLEGSQRNLLEYDYTRKVFNHIQKLPSPDEHCFAFAYETKTKNNANIWHMSSFHEVEVQKRFAVYASHQTGDNY